MSENNSFPCDNMLHTSNPSSETVNLDWMNQIREKMDILFHSNMDCISNPIVNLQMHFRMLIESILKMYPQATFSEIMISGLVNTCVCMHLLIWLECAKNTRQTIADMAKQKYGEPVAAYEPESFMAGIERALEKYKRNTDLNYLPENTDRVHTVKPFVVNRTTEYNYIELCLAEYTYWGNLDLDDTLILIKDPLKIATNAGRHAVLIEKYSDYAKFMMETAQEKNDKLFTIRSLAFFKYEQTYRFALAAKIAIYMKEHGIDINKPLPDALTCFFQRIPRINYDTGTVISIDMSPFLLMDNEFLYKAYNPQFADALSKSVILAREIVDQAHVIYNGFYWKDWGMEWSAKTFQQAAGFLRNESPMPLLLNSLQFNDDMKIKRRGTPALDEYIQALYLNLGLIELEQLDFSRDKIQPQVKEDSKRPNHQNRKKQ